MADIYIMKMKDSGGKIYDVYFTEVFYYGYFGDNTGSLKWPDDLDNILVDGNSLRNGITLPINNLWCYDAIGVNACIGAGYTSWRDFEAVGGSGTNRFRCTEGTGGYEYTLNGEFTSLTGSVNSISATVRFKNAASSDNAAVLLLRDLNGRHAIWVVHSPNDHQYNMVHVDSLTVSPGENWGVAGLTVKKNSTSGFATIPVITEDILINKTKQDPFEPGGNSGTGGGQGNFDGTSEPIDFPSMPTLSAADTNFITLYNPTLSQLRDLSAYMWSDLFSLDTLKKIFADPMDAILGLSILPVPIPSTLTKEVKVGNISTGVNMSVASTQFVEVDCGSINVNEYWGAYLDYEPYTQAQIFLPYIGTRPISVDEIMGKTVHVVYHVDILTGACCCFVKCGDSVLYTFNGQCSIPIPVTGANYTSIVNGVINIAASVGSLVATGGQAAPLIAAGSAAGATKAAVAKGAAAKAQLTNAQIGTASNVASNVANQMKPQIAKSGSISGGAGILNMQTPYLILIRPRQALPSKQNEFIGYPSLITVQLSELSGYTEVQSIHLENIPATSQELDEIEGLLKEGVIF